MLAATAGRLGVDDAETAKDLPRRPDARASTEVLTALARWDEWHGSRLPPSSGRRVVGFIWRELMTIGIFARRASSIRKLHHFDSARFTNQSVRPRNREGL